MKRVFTIVGAVLLLAATTAFADPSAKTKAAAVLRCPISGAVIASPKAAFNSEVYKGKTYYFCCAGCKPVFDKDPAKYAKRYAAWAKHPPTNVSM